MSTPQTLAIAVLVVDAFDVGALLQYWHSSSLPIDARPMAQPIAPSWTAMSASRSGRFRQPPGRASKCG